MPGSSSRNSKEVRPVYQSIQGTLCMCAHEGESWRIGTNMPSQEMQVLI